MAEWKSKADWKDRNWKYTPAAATDVSKTIARIKREMKEIAERTPVKVSQLKKVAK
jgi:hypothetical protein